MIELSKKHLPEMAVGFENPKVTIFIQDGGEFVKERKETYDVIITDSTDPVGSKYRVASSYLALLLHSCVCLTSTFALCLHY